MQATTVAQQQMQTLPLSGQQTQKVQIPNAPPTEEERIAAYREAEQSLQNEQAVRFRQGEFLYQGGEILLQKFIDDTQSIIDSLPNKEVLNEVWGGKSMWETYPPYIVEDEIRDEDGTLVQPAKGVREIHRKWHVTPKGGELTQEQTRVQ